MSKTETTEKALEVKRERVPIHQSRSTLDVPGLDPVRFFYRFIRIQNPQNVQRYLDAGFVFVDRQGDQFVGDKDVGTTEGFGRIFTKTGKDGVTLGLVCIPMEIWIADQKAKLAENRKLLDTQYLALQAQMDPKTGGYGHIGEHPALEIAEPGRPQRTRRI